MLEPIDLPMITTFAVRRRSDSLQRDGRFLLHAVLNGPVRGGFGAFCE